MIYWIVLCNVWINFVLGALIPITPKLNESMAGIAFSAFALMKVIIFVPSGYISDRIGHFTGFSIALIAQVLTLGLILHYPEFVWAARVCEGITLAFGTVAALSLFRIYSKDEKEFSKSISLLLGIGSTGFLIGPFFGYNINIDLALKILFAISIAFSLVHWIFYRIHLQSVLNFVSEKKAPQRASFLLILGFALVKGLGVGTEPLFGWWATENIGLSPLFAGFTFVCGAIGFMLGNLKPKLPMAYLGFFGILFLEISLNGVHWLWWPAMALLGLFSGIAINICLSKLGWDKPENIGFNNSQWLAVSDIPMMMTPALMWQVRESTDTFIRFTILSGVMLIALELIRRNSKN